MVSTRRSLRAPSRKRAVDAEHRRLLAAIHKGDARKAADAARAHVLNTLEEFDVAHT